MKTSGIFLVSFFLLVLSCKKDKIISNNGNLTFGNYSNMIVKKYEILIVGSYRSPKSFNLDVNNDQSEDIRLTSEVWGSLAIGENHPRSVIECLNPNMQLLGYFVNDTTFLFRQKSVFTGLNNIIQIDSFYKYTCHRILNTDSIVGNALNQFKVLPQIKGDIIKNGSTFKSDVIILIDDSYSFTYFINKISPDTSVYRHIIYSNDCNSFPIGEIMYIGIKITKDNIEKLGWIKLSIFDKNKIFILESAIQE